MLSRLRSRWHTGDPEADPARLAKIGAAVRARLESELGARNRGGRTASLYIFRDFLSPDECTSLIGAIDTEISPSPLFDDGGGAGIRTSSTHYFRDDDREAGVLAGRIDTLLGLDRTHAEPLQGQRYRPGEQYRHHCDFFRTERDHWQRERQRGGQRTWTAMVYLNAVEAGGATDFPRLGLSVQPERGMLIVWDNMNRSGKPNRATFHAGMPVEMGVKYVITQWYRLEPWRLETGLGAIVE